MLSVLGNFMTTVYTVFVILHVAASNSESISKNNIEPHYVSSWAVQLQDSASEDDARSIASSQGLQYEKILPNNYYLFTDEDNKYLVGRPHEHVTEALKSFAKVIWVEQQALEEFESRVTFSDPLWETQTHLESASSGNEIKQHVEDAWKEGYTGKNVTVVVIDNGVRGTHHELYKRYDKSVSKRSSSLSGGHGTHCAGVIAAEANNNLCGVGVAYHCNIAGIQLFVKDDATDADEARAFYREDINPSKADIFSNSWGPKDNGYTTRGPRPLSAAALKLGTEEGRGKLGNIYVFSCGNGARLKDSCAFDGYVNSIYTIAVASITKDGKVTGFSEACSSIMTAVYSTKMVTVSEKNDTGCVKNFGRTSAAGAFVSGILALALEANPNLTWRDMQHLVARSSTWSSVSVEVKRARNGKGFVVNDRFGFGVLDALELVKNAKKWNVSVPTQLTCTVDVIKVTERDNPRIPTSLNVRISEENLNCGSKLIRSLEHVQLRLDLQYTNRAVLVVDVTSPSGTSSRFVYPRPLDGIDTPKEYNDLVVTSVHFWGESVLGEWTVKIAEGEGKVNNIKGNGRLLNMSFTFYGTNELLNGTDIDDGDDDSNDHDDGDDDGNENDDVNDNDDNDDDGIDDGNENDDVNDNDNDDGDSDDDAKSKKGGIIAGAVIAALGILAASVLVAYKLIRRSKNSAQDCGPEQEQERLSKSAEVHV